MPLKPKAVPPRKAPARLKRAAHPIDTRSRLLFVTPIVTFLIAGLTKLVSWDVGWQGISLLVGFAIVGACLQSIPRRSVSWRTEPGSPYAALKQTIATMRVLVSIVMVLIPVTILATSDQILKSLPNSVEEYLSQLNAKTFAGGVVPVALEAERKLNVFLFVPIEGGAAGSPLLKFQPTTATRIAASGASEAAGDGQSMHGGVAGELYILQTTKIVDSIVKGAIMPMLHQFATLALGLSAIFVFVTLILEIFGDVLWRMQPTRRIKS